MTIVGRNVSRQNILTTYTNLYDELVVHKSAIVYLLLQTKVWIHNKDDKKVGMVGGATEINQIQ